MVKYKSLELKEKSREEKKSRLIEIAAEVFPKSKAGMYSAGLDAFVVHSKNGIYFFVDAGDNSITYDDEAALPNAKNLARAYGKRGLGKFTVQRERNY